MEQYYIWFGAFIVIFVAFVFIVISNQSDFKEQKERDKKYREELEFKSAEISRLKDIAVQKEIQAARLEGEIAGKKQAEDKYENKFEEEREELKTELASARNTFLQEFKSEREARGNSLIWFGEKIGERNSLLANVKKASFKTDEKLEEETDDDDGRTVKLPDNEKYPNFSMSTGSKDDKPKEVKSNVESPNGSTRKAGYV